MYSIDALRKLNTSYDSDHDSRLKAIVYSNQPSMYQDFAGKQI